MRHAARWLGPGAAIACVAGCEIFVGLSDIAFTGGTTTQSASGGGGAGASGAGSAGNACIEPVDCPPTETVCEEPRCLDGQCAIESTAQIPCEDGGTCDGNGRCIGKANGSDCSELLDCESGHCVAGTCASGVEWAW